MLVRDMSGPVIVHGAGSIGLRHVRVLRDRLGVRALAVPARADRADVIRDQGFEVVGTLEEALDRRPTAAVIATDTHRHVQDVLRVLPAMPVLIEKPVAPSVAEASPLRVAANATRAYVGYCMRFHCGLQVVRSRLAELGVIHSVRIECQSYLPEWRPTRDYRTSYSARKDEGGVLRDLSHELDYAAWLFGMPQRVLAVLKNSGQLEIDSEESADLLWSTTGGVVVSMHLDYLTRRRRRTIHVVGARGEITWDAILGEVRISVDGREELLTASSSHDEMLEAQARAFLGDPHQDHGPLATLADGLLALRIADAARLSHERRAWIDLSDVAQ